VWVVNKLFKIKEAMDLPYTKPLIIRTRLRRPVLDIKGPIVMPIGTTACMRCVSEIFFTLNFKLPHVTAFVISNLQQVPGLLSFK